MSYVTLCWLSKKPHVGTDAADSQDDRKNVQRAGNRNIIHLPALDLP
jgi:hypothetical protein